MVKNHLLTALVLLCLGACQKPKSYVRSTPYVSNNVKPGNFEGFGTISFNHLEILASYSPVNYLNLQAQSYLGEIGIINDYSIGGYFPIEDILVLRTDFGYGHGDLNISAYNSRESYHSIDDAKVFYEHVSKYDKLWFQPSIGFKVSTPLLIGVSARFNQVEYSKFRYEKVYKIQGRVYSRLSEELQDYDGRIIDPSIYAFYQNDPVGVFIQAGISQSDFTGFHPHFTREFLNVGLVLNTRLFERKSQASPQ